MKKSMKTVIKTMLLMTMSASVLAGCAASDSSTATPVTDSQSYTIGIGQFAAHGFLTTAGKVFWQV